MRRDGLVAVAIHDVQPGTFERCKAIRSWLAGRGIERATLLVIPAPQLHPFFREPGLVEWLTSLRSGGDAVAQHGLDHLQPRRASPLRQWLANRQGGRAAEFAGLRDGEVRSRLATGRRMLALADLEPRGFVAPAYAYTGELRRELAKSFGWWASSWAIEGPDGPLARTPAVGFGTSTAFKRRLSPTAARMAALFNGGLLRLDVHPADFEHERHVRALEAILDRASKRISITYDELPASR
jgi:predicted deacetylase